MINKVGNNSVSTQATVDFQYSKNAVPPGRIAGHLITVNRQSDATYIAHQKESQTVQSASKQPLDNIKRRFDLNRLIPPQNNLVKASLLLIGAVFLWSAGSLIRQFFLEASGRNLVPPVVPPLESKESKATSNSSTKHESKVDLNNGSFVTPPNITQGNKQSKVQKVVRSNSIDVCLPSEGRGFLSSYTLGLASKNTTTVLEEYQRDADQGVARTQHNLGMVYAYGLGLEKDEKKAIDLFKSAAEQGDAYAQYNLGYSYKIGQGVDRNHTEAVRLLQLSAEQGNVLAHYQLGITLFQDVSGAMKEAGVKYLRWVGNYLGIMPSQDVSETMKEAAVKHLRWAGDHAQVYAESKLQELKSILALEGKDKNEERRAYVKAQLDVLRDLLVGLGQLYDNGSVVGQDLKKASQMYQLANSLDSVFPVQFKFLHNATLNAKEQAATSAKLHKLAAQPAPPPPLQFLYETGILNYGKYIASLAKKYQLASEQGNASAQYNLGIMRNYGIGVEENLEEALRLVQLAAAQNHVAAQYTLGRLFKHGFLVDVDMAKAVPLYQSAAAQGNVPAQFGLATMYDAGLGVDQDKKEAANLYRLVSRQIDKYAQARFAQLNLLLDPTANGVDGKIVSYARASHNDLCNIITGLGSAYDGGHGVNQDSVEAARLYKLAADQDCPVAQFYLGTLYELGKGVKQDMDKAAELYGNVGANLEFVRARIKQFLRYA